MNRRLILFLFTIMSSISPGLFSQDISNSLTGLATIRDDVQSLRASSYDRTGGNNDRMENICEGEKRTIFEVSGAGMINHIWITIAPAPIKLSRNDIVIRMYWDQSNYASVESPIGPFFGQGWDEAYTFSSLPLAASPVNGLSMVCYFIMPFANGAKIEIENQSDKKIDAFYYYVDYVRLDSLPSKTGRFHAWYNRELTEAAREGENEWSLLGPTGENVSGKENYLVANINGKGHFVGINYYINSSSPIWYGEGDDMIYIDGDTLPTLHGTGTEDYFNSAWCPKTAYSHPYFGFARVNNDFGWLGRTHVYRFHISDPIYFNKSFRFTIEHGHNNVLSLDLASVAYWYQDQATPVPGIPSCELRKPKPLITPVDVHRWRNEWRINNGEEQDLWGNETESKPDIR
jgi:hypothetical protein